MSRTNKATLSAAFSNLQYALALISGFVIFPLVIRYVGANNYGLWMATGEVVGYLLLGDLGVFTVLPWLIAARDGAGDRAGISRFVANGIAIGTMIGVGFAVFGGIVWLVHPQFVGMKEENWAIVRLPLATLLGLTGLGFPLRPFTALMMGVQDISFGGPLSIAQSGLTVILTAALLTFGTGMMGLAVATAAPPILIGLAALARVFVTNTDLFTGGHCRPSWQGCLNLFTEGFGAWLGGLGVRLLTASNGLIFVGLGHPQWGTIFAATGKVAQIGQPLCGVIPDSGLIGLSQLHGEGNPERTRRTVLCLLLLYLLIPGAMALALFVGNPAFVQVWLKPSLNAGNYASFGSAVGGSAAAAFMPSLYAGNYVNALITVNLIIGSLANGMFKVVGVLGYRVQVGLGAIASGVLYLGLGYVLGMNRGLTGVAEAAVITSAGFLFPYGLFVVARLFSISPKMLLRECVGPWALRSLPLFAVAAGVGVLLAPTGWPGVAAAAGVAVALGGLYLLSLRSLLAQLPWPARVHGWMIRLWLISQPPSGHSPQ